MREKKASLVLVAAVLSGVCFLAGLIPLWAYPQIAKVLGFTLGPIFLAVCFSFMIAERVGDGPAEKVKFQPRGLNLRGMTVSYPPPTVMLLIVIALAVFVTCLVTGNTTEVDSPPAVSPKSADPAR